MEDLLTKIGLNSRTTIGVSVSSNNLIEMISVDKVSRSITKYAARELKYNNAIREIIDYEEFAEILLDLFKELGLNPRSCNVILNMPNVHFGFINLPLILPDEQIATAISSEVEQLYLFKRHEPVISWNTIDENKDADKRHIVYAAMQEVALTNIGEVFEDIGVKLIAIENSYSSMLKGIQYSKIVEEEMSNNSSLNILLISTNSYAIFCLSGNKVVDYYEEPLAIKSFTNEEVYLAISSAASNTLANYPTRNLLLISETNEVSAELLSDKINFSGAIKYLDRNKYSDKSFINAEYSVLQNYIPMISVESVGAATYNFENYPIRFNFLSDTMESNIPQVLTVTVFGKEIEIDRKAIVTIMASVLAILLIVFILIGFSLNYLNDRIESELTTLSKEQQTLEAKIKESKISVDVADIYSITQQIYAENKKSFILYNAISSEIPKEVWLDSFYTNSDGEVFITGKSTSSEYIYPFFKGLKTANPDLFLSKLQLDSDSPLSMNSSNSLYSFEITSTKNKKTSPDEAQQTGTDATGTQNTPANGAQPPSNTNSFPSFSPITRPGGNPVAPGASPISTINSTPSAPPQNQPGGAPPPITSAPR